MDPPVPTFSVNMINAEWGSPTGSEMGGDFPELPPITLPMIEDSQGVPHQGGWGLDFGVNVDDETTYGPGEQERGGIASWPLKDLLHHIHPARKPMQGSPRGGILHTVSLLVPLQCGKPHP